MADSPPQSEPDPQPLDPEVAAKLESLYSHGTCSPSDLDEKVLHQLSLLKPKDAIEALAKLEGASRTSEVRKPSAYLAGVIRRFAQLTGSEGGATAADLVPEARALLERLYARGLVREGDLDGKCLGSLAGKPTDIQILVIDTFSDRNLRGIRNMAAFFMSHFSQVERDLRVPRHSGAPPPGSRGGYGGPPPRGRYEQYESPPRGRYEQYGPPPSAAPRSPGPGYGPPPQTSLINRGGPPYHHAAPAGQYDYGGPPPSQQYVGAAAAAAAPLHHPVSHDPRDLRGAAPAPMASAPPPAVHSSFAPPAAAAAIAPPAHIKHFALEQVQWGVRVDEFQGLNSMAKYVHPAAALRLQQLWDVDQNKLVSVLSDASWEALAGLDARNGVAVVEEVAEAMKTAPDDISTINSIFLMRVAKYPKRPDAPTRAAVGIGGQQQQQPALLAPAQIPAAQPGMVPAVPPYQPLGTANPPLYATQPPGAGDGPAAPYQTQPSYEPLQAYHPATGGPPPSQQYTALPPGPAVQLPGPLGTLPIEVQSAIDHILVNSRGLIKLEHFNDKVVDIFHGLSVGTTLAALEEFGRNDPAHMRSPTAYLIGCIRKVDGSGGGGGGHRGSIRGGPLQRGRGRGGGGRGRGRGASGESRRYDPY